MTNTNAMTATEIRLNETSKLGFHSDPGSARARAATVAGSPMTALSDVQISFQTPLTLA
jgi:hypothetical protein